MGSIRIIAGHIALATGLWPMCAQAADEPLVMVPTAGWVMDYDDNSCALRRTFQSGDQRAILEFRQYGPGDQFEVLILSDTVTRRARAPRVRFEPDAAWIEPPAARLAESAAGKGVLFQSSLRPQNVAAAEWGEADRDARERGIAAVTVANTFERDLTLQTGTMNQPMAAMRACVQDLVATSGFDRGPPGPLARGPVPVDLQSWARRTQEYYPPDMVRSEKEARVAVRLLIGKDGRPRSCFAEGSAEQSFLDTACGALMQFARFEPAIDANGEPAVGSYSTTIVYDLD